MRLSFQPLRSYLLPTHLPRGAKLRFVDIEPLSLGWMLLLERAVSERTRAIILVHYGGAPAAALSDNSSRPVSIGTCNRR